MNITVLEKLKAKLEKRPFLKNVMVLISGNIMGYAVNLLTLPLISRVFSPEQIGEYDLILSSGRFIMEIISLGLMIAIMLPDEEKKAKQLCQIVFACNLVFLSAFCLILFMIRDRYQIFETSISYLFALFLLALYLFTFNMQNLFYSYTNRCKLYGTLFWNPLLLAITNVGVSLVLGVCGLGTAGYLIGTISSYVICTIHMRKYVSPFSTHISIWEWKERIHEYRELVLVQLPANVIAQVGNEIPTQYLGRIFGATMLGGYSMAVKILNIPVSLLSVPVNRVVYQSMAEKAKNHESVGEFLFQILERNIQIALIPVGLLVITGEKIIPLILGSSWSEAGEYIAILGIIYLLKYCSACVSGTFVVMGHQKLSLWMSFINLAKFGVCFGISYILKLNILHTILFYAVLECLYQLLNLILCVHCTGYSMKKFMIFFGKYIIGGNILIYLLYFILKITIY